jgi:hypothetical protein
MKYAIYARKSTSREDKQAQSIDDQLGALRHLAEQRGLTVVEEYTEARSAKAPGGRPVFTELTKHDSVLNAVNFATHAVAKFEAADVWAKRRIVQVLGGSYVLTGKVLTLERHPLLHFIAENRKAIELAIIGSGKQKTGSLKPALSLGSANGSRTRDLLDENQVSWTTRRWRPTFIQK